jgi:hypothetical protein
MNRVRDCGFDELEMNDDDCLTQQEIEDLTEGEFALRNLPDGYHANVRLPGRQIYSGDVKNGQMCGHGTVRSSDGSVYVGSFLNSLRHGKGVLTSASSKYTGDFAFGYRQGVGTYEPISSETSG